MVSLDASSLGKKLPVGKPVLQHREDSRSRGSSGSISAEEDGQSDATISKEQEKALVRKIDLRLCSICGILASLDLLDSNIISSAAVTSLFDDLDLYGNRFSISIFIFTISSIAFQLPSTIAVRYVGPRIWFASITFSFGLITLCTAFISSWKEMIALRVLLGIAMSGIYPGLSYLISCWYTRKEQQLRFAYLQTGEVFILATGTIVNYGLNHLNGQQGLAGWSWMYLVQGIVACVMGIVTYWWIPMLPDQSYTRSFNFLTEAETALAASRIQRDRGDVNAAPFSWKNVLVHAGDPKIYGFGCMFFLLNVVSTGLSYFLPIILQSGMGFSENKSILLNSPPYYWSIIPVVLSSWIADRYHLRGPIIIFNSLCVIVGFCMLGFTTQPAVRYVGTCLSTGAYVSNWAALSAYYSNNITGQWKRVFTAAVVTAFNGAGGIAGSFIFRQNEAPRYFTAIGVAIGSHSLMIIFVLGFSVAFYIANRQQAQGKRLIEETVGFRHTY